MPNFNSSAVSVVNIPTNTVTATISVGALPDSVVVNPTTNTVYVASAYGTVSVIDGSSNTVTGTLNNFGNAGGNGLYFVFDPNTDTVY